VTTGRDDDALTWDGDDDPTLDLGTPGDAAPVAEAESLPAGPTAPTAELPKGYTAVGRGSDAVAAADGTDAASISSDSPAREDEPAEREPMGNASLITIGVLGGVYALFAIGWIIGGLRLQARLLLDDPMFTVSLWLAVAAPVLWFATVYLLTRGSRPWVRFVWLAAGAILLVPWPFVLLGSVAS
jgi:hypothetical protein